MTSTKPPTPRCDLKPIVRFDRADAQESFQVTAQRQRDEGHYVAAINFPGAGQWNWRVDVGLLTQDLPAVTVQSAPAKAQPASFIRLLEFVNAIRRVLAGSTAGATAPASQAAPLDPVALGTALFSAKGCVMCHAHAAITVQDGPFGLGEVEPPNLSQNEYGDEYLRLWLRDPQAVKPATQMPRLELREGEIDALIAFLPAR